MGTLHCSVCFAISFPRKNGAAAAQQWKEQRAISLVNYLMRAPRVADFDQITAAEFNILKKVGFFPDHYIDIYDRDGTEWFRIPEYDGPDEW